jgi:PAS domain S-box-containing protein
VARRQTVIVSDIQTDPLWTNYRALAGRFGLRACWSTPIFARSGKVLGTFALYYREPREPAEAHFELFEVAATLASIAIERKAEAEALRQITTLQQAILESARVAIISTDLEGRLLSFNRAAERMLGWDASEVIGSLNIRQLHDPAEIDPRGGIFGTQGAAMEAEEREWTYIARDAARIPVLVTTTPLADREGRFNGYLCVGTDLTARKQDEKLRNELEAQLRQSQKMQAIGTLAGGIAHDFNNILSAILGNAELLKMDLPDSPEARETLAGILKATERARILVQHILAFSRVETPERKRISLRPVVVEALELIRATLPASIEIRAELEETRYEILGNATQVHQVLMNLCSNAHHAIGKAQGCITIVKKAVEIDEATALLHPGLFAGRHMEISITDTGCGMDAGTLERIFEPFYTTKAPGQGTGLGLAVVHGIMQTHDGVITVTSRPGQGSTFRLFFPVIGTATAEVTEASTALPLGQGQRILLVDDESALVRLAEKVLARINYKTQAYTSPVEALAAFTAAPDSFDLVVTDLTMPQMTGLDLARQIPAIRPGMPIILCTGHRTLEDEVEFARLGIHCILSKPFHTDALAETVYQLLCGRASQPAVGIPGEPIVPPSR